MKKQTLSVQDRYAQQVKADRRAAAIQRRLDRLSGGLADVDQVNLVYN